MSLNFEPYWDPLVANTHIISERLMTESTTEYMDPVHRNKIALVSVNNMDVERFYSQRDLTSLRRSSLPSDLRLSLNKFPLDLLSSVFGVYYIRQL
jgi:hypothetical protein